MTTIAPAQARSTLERTLLWLEALLAIGAYAGAVGLATGGVDLGEATARLPFGSTVLAGVALALVNGALPTAVFVLALRHHRLAPAGHLVVGIALTGWIVVQIGFLGPPVHPLQVIYFVWGLVIVGLAVQYRRSQDDPVE